MHLRQSLSPVDLEVVDSPLAVGGGIDGLERIASGPALTCKLVRCRVNAKLQPLPVNIIRDGLHSTREARGVWDDGFVGVAIYLPAVIAAGYTRDINKSTSVGEDAPCSTLCQLADS